MKKVFKKVVLSLVVLMALIGIGGTAAFASGYLEWGGSDDFRQAMINLNLISDRGVELQDEIQGLEDDLDTVQDTVAAKEKKIQGLEADLVTAQNSVDAKEEEIKGLKDDLGTAQGEREALTNHVRTVMDNVRNKTGANRYKELADGANHLAGLLGLDKNFPDGLGAVHQDALLGQAKEDMEDINLKSQDILNTLGMPKDVDPEDVD